ncbi:hypothetical protein BH23GEM2_BH23GEM2_24430 [soil metagenome]
MRTMLVIHIAAGGLGLLAGYIALCAPKGAALHRQAGMLFVYAMLAMALFGGVITVARSVAVAINLPAALISAYLVITSLATVRTPAVGSRWLNSAAMLLALTVAVTCLAFGLEAIATGRGREGMPAFPFFMFGVVGLVGAIGDIRMMRSGPLRGTRRIARHLWRMSFALFIAAMSFFIGQMKVIPEPIRIPALLALPVLAVLVTMLYWLWRVRFRRNLRGVTVIRGLEASETTHTRETRLHPASPAVFKNGFEVPRTLPQTPSDRSGG